MMYYNKKDVEALIKLLKLSPIATRSEQLKLIREPMPEFNYYTVSVDYENSSQKRGLGSYRTIEEVIASIPYLMKEYEYGFGDIHVYVYRPDPLWDGCFCEIMCVYR